LFYANISGFGQLVRKEYRFGRFLTNIGLTQIDTLLKESINWKNSLLKESVNWKN